MHLVRHQAGVEPLSLSTIDLDGDGLSSCDGDCLDYDPDATDYSLVSDDLYITGSFHTTTVRYQDSRGLTHFKDVYTDYWGGGAEDSWTESVYDAFGVLLEESFENDSDLSGGNDFLSHSVFSYAGDGTLSQKDTEVDSDADGETDYSELVLYTYGEDGLLASESLVRTDPDGALLYGLYTSYSYTDGLLSTEFFGEDSDGDGASDNSWNNIYGYDAEGRISSKQGTAATFTTSHYSYVYDGDGNLSSKNVDFVSGGQTYTDSYAWSHSLSSEGCE